MRESDHVLGYRARGGGARPSFAGRRLQWAIVALLGPSALFIASPRWVQGVVADRAVPRSAAGSVRDARRSLANELDVLREGAEGTTVVSALPADCETVVSVTPQEIESGGSCTITDVTFAGSRFERDILRALRSTRVRPAEAGTIPDYRVGLTMYDQDGNKTLAVAIDPRFHYADISGSVVKVNSALGSAIYRYADAFIE